MDIKAAYEKFMRTPSMRRLGGLLALGLLIGALSGLIPNGESRTVQPTTLEMRMESVLGMIDGAGAVRVLLNYDKGESTGVFSSGDTGGICGAVVVAEGANDLRVRIEIQRAVSTLLNVDNSAVEVLTMKGGF